MRIPIRMISIATMFFWLFLIAFFATAVYSVKDVRFDFGYPQLGLTADNKILFSLPVMIDNRGYYNIGSLNVTTLIFDKEGLLITQGFTFVPVIERDRQIRTTHNMTIDMDELLQNNQDFLFNDTALQVREVVGLELAEVIPVQASTNVTVPWGAPLYNITLGEIQYTSFNGTHVTAIASISFENHAFFNFSGGLQICMYNSADTFLCEGQTTIEALQNSLCQAWVELDVPIAGFTEDGHIEVYVSTPFFNPEPLVIEYG